MKNRFSYFFIVVMIMMALGLLLIGDDESESIDEGRDVLETEPMDVGHLDAVCRIPRYQDKVSAFICGTTTQFV